VIVGSAIVRRLEPSSGADSAAALKSVEEFAQSMVAACGKP
jgi:tryptophan synthase alpha subunit